MNDSFRSMTDSDIRNIVGGIITNAEGEQANSECVIFRRPASGEDEACDNFVYKSLDIEYTNKKQCKDCQYFKSKGIK